MGCSRNADRLYERASDPAVLRRLQGLLRELGPADADDGKEGGKEEWDVETTVARVTAVKEASSRARAPTRIWTNTRT